LATTVVTNGSQLTPDLYQRFCEEGVGTVRISITGMINYGKSHGCDDNKLNELLKTLEYIMFNSGVTKIAVNCVADSPAEYQLMFDALAGNVMQLEIWSPHNWGKAFKFREKTTKRLRNCGRIFTGPLQVLVDGRVNVCCFDHDGTTTLGSLKKDSLKDIFSGSQYVNQVVCSNTGDWRGQKYPCAGCDQRNVSKDGVLLYSSRAEEDRVFRTSTSFQRVDTQALEVATTPCMKCHKKFTPVNKFNRLCHSCKTSNRNVGRFGGGVKIGGEGI